MGIVKTFVGIGLVAILCAVACGRRDVGPQAEPVVSVADTLAEVEVEDSDTIFSSPVEEKVFSGADGFFEEFLYEFSADTAMQRHRIRFPLPYHPLGGAERLLDEGEWFASGLLNLMDIYHTLFERDAEMEIEWDASVRKANLDCVDMRRGIVRSFSFEKPAEQWVLGRIRELKLSAYRHHEFFAFYHRFVTDSLYQSRHVNDPMTFVTIDPEDGFSTLEASIDMEQWFAFRPILPEHYLVNVDYGVKVSRRPKRKILTCKSLGGNFTTTSYFRRINGEWMLTRFEDVSN